MLSGGLDSTFLLYDLLNNTDYKIHTHHISLRYDTEPRWREEDNATAKILEYCHKNYREFTHSFSRFDFTGFKKHIGWDSDVQMLAASKVAPNLITYAEDYITLALGWTTDSFEKTEVIERLARNVTGGIWQALLNSIEPENIRQRIDPKIALPIIEKSMYKKDILKEIPKELLQFSWSCRKPDYSSGTPQQCGKCHACKLINKSLKGQ